MSAPAEVARSRSTELDAVALEVIRHGRRADGDGDRALGRSQVVREMLDYSTAVFDVTGGSTAEPTRIPMHLNSMTRALRTMLVTFPVEGWGAGEHTDRVRANPERAWM